MSTGENSGNTGVKTTLIALPILYVLSIGPAVYLQLAIPLSMDSPLFRAMNAFYSPLAPLHDHAPFRDPFQAYLLWWMQLAGSTP
jgi:hypothetical protein